MKNRSFQRIISGVVAVCVFFGLSAGVSFPVKAQNSLTAAADFALADVTTELTQELAWIDVRNDNSPIEVHGLYKYTDRTIQDGNFVRLDPEVAAAVTADANENFQTNGTNVWGHNQDTAGGRVRFSTDSRYVAVQALLPVISTWGTSGCVGQENVAIDVYVDTEDGSVLAGTIMPKNAYSKGATNVVLEGVIDLGSAEARNITVYMPILNPVKEFYIGLSTDAGIGENTKRYVEAAPVVWYGSSLTQGGSVSHPGYTYINQVAQYFNHDYVNLGMWGSAHGQNQIAEYIAGLDMSMFIMDYDRNEDKVDTLKTNHWNLYKTVRASHKDIPIIFISCPSPVHAQWEGMRQAILENYEAALAEGDENVYFIDGMTIFAYASDYADCIQNYDSATQDIKDPHHTDYGAELFAQAVIKKILDIQNGWNETLPLYETDFSSIIAEDWSSVPSVSGGKATFEGVGATYTLTGAEAWENYAVEAVVNVDPQTNGTWAGICARGTDKIRLVLGDVKRGDTNISGTSKLRIRAYYNGSSGYIDTEDIYDYDTDYTLKIVVKDSQVRFYVNGQQLFADQTFLTSARAGTAGIYTLTGSYALHATVDDFKAAALGTANVPVSIQTPQVVLAQKDQTPKFDLTLNYGAYGTGKLASDVTGVTVTADTCVEGITKYTVGYGNFTATGTLYVLEDITKAYYDGFDSLNTGAWSVDGNVSANGKLTIDGKGYVYLDKLLGATQWENYIAECSVTVYGLTTGSGQSPVVLSVRNAVANKGYEYGPLVNNADHSGAGFRLYERGSATVNDTYDEAIPACGQAYRLRIVAEGSNIRFYLQQKDAYVLTHQVTDAIYDAGSVRLFSGTNYCKAEFDDFLIVPLDEKTMKGISLPTETVDLPLGKGLDVALTVNYGMHGSEVISTAADGVITDFDPMKTGYQTVHVTYGGLAAQMQVCVYAQSGVYAGNFTVSQNETPDFDLWEIYGPVWVRKNATEENISGLNTAVSGKQCVTVNSGGFTTTVTATVTGQTVYQYVDFDAVENGTAPDGWNVKSFGAVDNGVFSTNSKTAYYLNSTVVSNVAELSVSADFCLTDEQLLAYEEAAFEGAYTGYGVVRFGTNNRAGQNLGFGILLDGNGQAHLALVGQYGVSATVFDTIVFAKTEFVAFETNRMYNLQLCVLGNTAYGILEGKVVLQHSFDEKDTAIADGMTYYNPAGFYTDVIASCKRHGVWANGQMAPGQVKVQVNLDNFVLQAAELPRQEAGDVTYGQKQLALGADLAMDFYVAVSDWVAADRNAAMCLTVGEQTQMLSLGQATKTQISGDNRLWYVFTAQIPVKDMTKNISLQLVNGQGNIGRIYTYTVQEYLQYLLDHDASEKVRTVCQALLDYGAAAEKHFTLRAGGTVLDENLANGGDFGGRLNDVAVPADYAPTKSGSIDGITCYATSLVLESATAIRLYFDATEAAWVGTEVSVDVLGATYQVERLNNRYVCVEIKGIHAADLDTQYTVILTRGEEHITICYAGLSYAWAVLNSSTNETLCQMVRAMYQYWQATEAYREIGPETGENEFEILPI